MSISLRLRSKLQSLCTIRTISDHNVGEKAAKDEYCHAKTGTFFQRTPALQNPYKSDPILDKVLRSWIPKQSYSEIAADLTCFGDRVQSELLALGHQCEQQQPSLQQFDAWGNRIDKLIVSSAWNKLKSIAAEEGLIGIAYERKHGQWSRLHQIAKIYLFDPASGLTTCPLAMTDGAAKTLQSLNMTDEGTEMAVAFQRLVSRDSKKYWTSGQWMTERKGGSDVAAGCDTFAVKQSNDTYKLYGYKWFSSACDADMALTLARITDPNGDVVQGSKGLSLFYLTVRDAKTGQFNGIQMIRLKNKLGTKQLATAELLLDGTEAILISAKGKGVASISHMLNITRLHNSVAACSSMRFITSLARDYAEKREVFGRKLADWPLHVATLAEMELETRGCLMLLLESARLLGLRETGRATDHDSLLLRLLTPVIKLYTAKKAVSVASEGLECFGGQGYIEDTGLPRILRDAQVLPIWEGTTNVLAMDTLRALNSNGSSKMRQAFRVRIESLCGKPENDDVFGDIRQLVLQGLDMLEQRLELAEASKYFALDRAARKVAFSIAQIYAGALLLDLSRGEPGNLLDKQAALRFCNRQPLVPVWDSNNNNNEMKAEFEKELVFGKGARIMEDPP